MVDRISDLALIWRDIGTISCLQYSKPHDLYRKSFRWTLCENEWIYQNVNEYIYENALLMIDGTYLLIDRICLRKRFVVWGGPEEKVSGSQGKRGRCVILPRG